MSEALFYAWLDTTIYKKEETERILQNAFQKQNRAKLAVATRFKSFSETKSGWTVDHTLQERIEDAYLIFVIFLHEQNFWRIKFTPKKHVYYDKIHRKLPIFALLRQNTQ